MIAQHLIDLGHIGKHGRVNLRRAARDNDASVGIIALGFTDLTAALGHGVIGHSAGIDDHRVFVARVPRILRDDIRLISVQPTAECDDFRRMYVGCIRHPRHVVEKRGLVKSGGQAALAVIYGIFLDRKKTYPQGQSKKPSTSHICSCFVLFMLKTCELPALTAFPHDPKRHWKMFLDFDSFFAHVEKQADPSLWDKPVAVAPLESPASGVIACCYQAKALGVKRGMKRVEAEALAPEIVFRHARHDEYIYRHWDILKVIENHAPVEKAWSVDEMSVDLKRIELARATDIVHAIKAELREKLGPLVTASFGLAQTGLLAKIASEMNKPDGLVVLHPDEMPGRLYDLPLEKIPGVGGGMIVRLRRAGITTTKELLDLQPKHARRIWGSVEGERLWRALHGQHTERPETTAPAVRKLFRDAHASRCENAAGRTYRRTARISGCA